MRKFNQLLKKLRSRSQRRSLEMNDHEAICRICFDDDTETGGGLISPCMCKGTQQFVHRSCLDKWRTNGDPFALYYCPTCKARYHLRAKLMKSHSWYRMMYYINVAGDTLFAFVVLLTMVSILVTLAALVNRMQSSNIHPVLFSYCIGICLMVGLCAIIEERAIFRDALCYFFYGYDVVICFSALRVVFFPFIAGIVAISGMALVVMLMFSEMKRIRMINHDIFIENLRKAELDYVVEDLFGHYTPPWVDEEEELALEFLRQFVPM